MASWIRSLLFVVPLAGCSILGGPSLEGDWEGDEDCQSQGFSISIDLDMELEKVDKNEYEGELTLSFADDFYDIEPSEYDVVIEVEDVGGWPKEVDAELDWVDCSADDEDDCIVEYRGDWEDRDNLELSEIRLDGDWIDLDDLQGCDFDFDRDE